jgi:anthranilate/para-aminobenzoate synthase component II
MQNQGALELLGICISTPFLREAFDKYGIKVHAFKHGKYKSEFKILVFFSTFPFHIS